MNPKVKAFLHGCAEAFGGGFVLGLAVVWAEPNNIVFTAAGLLDAVRLGAQMGVFYLLGFLRMNVAFAKPPERLTEDEKRRILGLTPKRPNG
jgi:hypothetical protein